MGRELRDAIRTVLEMVTGRDDGGHITVGAKEEAAIDVLRAATSGWIPGEREEAFDSWLR